MIHREILKITPKSSNSIYNISEEIEHCIIKSKIKNGLINIFTRSSTTSITTMEFEPGLEKDLVDFLKSFIKNDNKYIHNETSHENNTAGHLKSSIIGPEITIPFENGKIMLDTWQQIVFINSDNKEKSREIIITIYGEKE